MAKAFIWTKEMDEDLIQNYNKKMAKEFAHKYNCTAMTVYNRCMKLGIKKPLPNLSKQSEYEIKMEEATAMKTKVKNLKDKIHIGSKVEGYEVLAKTDWFIVLRVGGNRETLQWDELVTVITGEKKLKLIIDEEAC